MCRLITITVCITILNTLTTILTPEALLYFLHSLFALPPSARPSQYTNLKMEALL
jgi:hypothetical protein